MNLTQISTGAALAGLAALALLLFALQRLRVRHEERVVVTAMFWREALEESRARTLVERFRHPLTYLLLLATAGFLWFSFARIDERRSEGVQHLLVLDGSAGMALTQDGVTRFDLAKAALRRELARVPRDRTEVVLVGATQRVVLAPGEEAALIDSRLEGLAPAPVPSSIDALIRQRARLDSAAAQGAPRAPLRVVVLGDAPLSDELVGLGSDQLTIQRAELDTPSGMDRAVGRAVTALGVAPAASGAWGRVDLQFDVRGPGVAAGGVQLELDGARWKPSADGAKYKQQRYTSDHLRGTITDLPARGATFTVRVAGDPSETGSPLDDAGSIVLPNRPLIRVALVGAAGVDEAFAPIREVLAIDPAVELTADSSGADVVVGRAADLASAGGARPALVLSDAGSTAEAILVGHSADVTSEEALARAVGQLGLDHIDASTLADELGAAITVGAAPASARRVELWEELLSIERTRFVESRAFPLLVGRAVRWLASAESVVPYVAAGRVIPARIGERATGPGSIQLASTGLAASPDFASKARATLEPAAAPGPGPWRPFTWILLLALGLLTAEWILFQRGRIA